MNKEKFMQSNVALYGMFISVALVMSYIESLIPIAYPVMGMKIGLANIVILWVLYSIDIKAAALISILRVLLVGFMFGSLYSIMFGLSGAVLSLLVMFLLKKTGKFKVLGVSVAGGVAHNIGQIIAAMFILENARLVYYLPFLIVGGVVAGIAVGILGGVLYKKVKLAG